jgi:hypothetical protein
VRVFAFKRSMLRINFSWDSAAALSLMSNLKMPRMPAVDAILPATVAGADIQRPGHRPASNSAHRIGQQPCSTPIRSRFR